MPIKTNATMEKYELINKMLAKAEEWLRTRQQLDNDSIEEFHRYMMHDTANEMPKWGDTLTHNDGTILKVHHIGSNGEVYYIAKYMRRSVCRLNQDTTYCHYGYIKDCRKSTEDERRLIDEKLQANDIY
jgi:hypothetical protein